MVELSNNIFYHDNQSTKLELNQVGLISTKIYFLNIYIYSAICILKMKQNSLQLSLTGSGLINL
jgi:hypothetical protein